MTIFRFLLAPILGIVVIMFTATGIEAFGQYLYPPPAEITELTTQLPEAFKLQDQEALDEIRLKLDAAMSTYFNSAPVGALLFVMFAWIAAAFFGGLVAAGVAPMFKIPMAIFIGFIDVMGILVVALQIDYPIWMPIGGMVGGLAMSWVAGVRQVKTAERRKQTTSGPAGA